MVAAAWVLDALWLPKSTNVEQKGLSVVRSSFFETPSWLPFFFGCLYILQLSKISINSFSRTMLLPAWGPCVNLFQVAKSGVTLRALDRFFSWTWHLLRYWDENGSDWSFHGPGVSLQPRKCWTEGRRIACLLLALIFAIIALGTNIADLESTTLWCNCSLTRRGQRHRSSRTRAGPLSRSEAEQVLISRLCSMSWCWIRGKKWQKGCNNRNVWWWLSRREYYNHMSDFILRGGCGCYDYDPGKKSQTCFNIPQLYTPAKHLKVLW